MMMLFQEQYISMCLKQQIKMQGCVYYIRKDLIANIKEEEVLEKYQHVTLEDGDLKIIDLDMEVTSHRLLLKSTGVHAFIIQGDSIKEVGISESGMLWSKQYFVKVVTTYGKVKFQLKNYNQAKITIQSMMKKKAWENQSVGKQNQNTMYMGIFNKIGKEKEKISSQGVKVQQSFSSFDTLFGNLRDIKKIMNDMKSTTGQSDGDNSDVNKILKNMGFVSIIDKDEAGNDYYRQLATDLYNVCQNSLFKTYGGMVSLLDLFYFYNKKRQMSLVSPQEILKACEQFQHFGLNARLVSYPNNIKMIESTSFDPEKDFNQNYSKFFQNFTDGVSAEDVARAKGHPLAIVEIKLKKAARKGKLAVADRIEGTKYYKNLLLTI